MSIDADIKKVLEEGELIKSSLKEGVHFFCEGDNTFLMKGGAEVIARVKGLSVTIETEIFTVTGLEPYVRATAVVSGDGAVLAEGFGARSLFADQYNLNYSQKMAAKSAYIDGVLRAVGLSWVFAQDKSENNCIHQPSKQAVSTIGAAPETVEFNVLERLFNAASTPHQEDLLAAFNVPELKHLSAAQVAEAIEFITQSGLESTASEPVTQTVQIEGDDDVPIVS